MQLPIDGDKTGRNLGEEEIALLRKVIESGTLNRTGGTMVKEFEKRFARRYGVNFCVTTNNGTAAMHTAIAAINPEPGDEIITTPITDMGAITPIIYQTAIPVFADVDPDTYNVTAETIERKITGKTRAIIVTHLFGNPCDMGPIMDLAKSAGIPVIEDACQAYLSECNGRLIGTIGDIGVFSLQQGKHITTGEGGIIITNNSNERFNHRIRLFIDKAWDYDDPEPDHDFLALNCRMTELQGAVACAQLEKLDDNVNKRIQMAKMLSDIIKDVEGVAPPLTTSNGRHVFWRYPLRIDNSLIRGGVDAFSQSLRSEGIYCVPRYIQKPAFMCRVLRDRKTFGSSRFPFENPYREGETALTYCPEDYPGTMEALSRVLVLPWNERYNETHIEFIGECILKTVGKLKR